MVTEDQKEAADEYAIARKPGQVYMTPAVTPEQGLVAGRDYFIEAQGPAAEEVSLRILRAGAEPGAAVIVAENTPPSRTLAFVPELSDGELTIEAKFTNPDYPAFDDSLEFSLHVTKDGDGAALGVTIAGVVIACVVLAATPALAYGALRLGEITRGRKPPPARAAGWGAAPWVPRAVPKLAAASW